MKTYLTAFILLLVFSLGSPHVEAQDIFEDLNSDDPSMEAIESLYDSGVIQGYDAATFRSTNTINRAEFLKIVVEAVTDNPTGSDCFSDVGDDWYAKYVCYAKAQGYISGYDDGTFKPGAAI